MAVNAPIKPRRFLKQKEENLQRRICKYLQTNYAHTIFFSDASGVKMSDTKRMSMHAMKSKDLRVPDIIIDFPSRGYHGARLEVKPEGTTIYKKDGTLRKDTYVRRFKNGSIKRGDHLAEQADSLLRYNDAGYFARFVVGFDDAKKKIDWYMENENTQLF